MTTLILRRALVSAVWVWAMGMAAVAFAQTPQGTKGQGPLVSGKAPLPTATQPSGPAQDFIEEARMIYRAVACADTTPLPQALEKHQTIIAAHCKALNTRKDMYRRRYVTKAREFIAALRPAGLPDVVVYPFGGGDLISALVAFPDAREITTLSLEHAGDPRRIRDMSAPELRESLRGFSVQIGGMLSVSNNTSENMSEAHQNLLPVQLASFLTALAVHDYEPVSVRYFTLGPDGAIRYLGGADIGALEDERAKKLKHDWAQPNFSPAFSSVEIGFRRRGAGAGEPVRIHRHIAANLADVRLSKDPSVLRHLEAKGQVSVMTKAASYLLWLHEFAMIRDYLLKHAAWMISDSTGIPPMYAGKAGMVQMTLGKFESAFLKAPERHSQDFRTLWAKQPFRPLSFRFGYVDSLRQPHLLITEPKATARSLGLYQELIQARKAAQAAKAAKGKAPRQPAKPDAARAPGQPAKPAVPPSPPQ